MKKTSKLVFSDTTYEGIYELSKCDVEFQSNTFYAVYAKDLDTKEEALTCLYFEFTKPVEETPYIIFYGWKDEGEIKRIDVSNGYNLTEKDYPKLPEGQGYTAHWSTEITGYIDYKLEIYTIIEYDVYNVTYVDTMNSKIIDNGIVQYTIEENNSRELRTLFNANKKFLGWSEDSNSSTYFVEFTIDKNNLHDYTLYAIYGEYSEVEKEFYTFYNDLMLTRKIMFKTNDYEFAFDIDNQYQYENAIENQIETLYKNEYLYNFSMNEYYYSFKDFERDCPIYLTDYFGQVENIRNIFKTENGYSYSFYDVNLEIIISEGKVTSIIGKTSEQTMTYQVSYDFSEKQVPTDFNFVTSETFYIVVNGQIENVYRDNVNKDNSFYDEYKHKYSNISFDDCPLIGMYVDPECTVEFTEEYRNKHIDTGYEIYFMFVTKDYLLEQEFEFEIQYRDGSNVLHKQTIYTTLDDLSALYSIVNFKGETDFGLVSESYSIIYGNSKDIPDLDSLGYYMDGLLTREYFSGMKIYIYKEVYNEGYNFVEVTIYNEKTIKVPQLFKYNIMAMEKDGMYTEYFFTDANLKEKIDEGYCLYNGMVIYPKWTEGKLVNYQLVEVNKSNNTTGMTYNRTAGDNMSIYEYILNVTSWPVIKGIYYDKELTRLVQYDDVAIDNYTYYIDNEAPTIHFNINMPDGYRLSCSGTTHLSLKNNLLFFNLRFRKYLSEGYYYNDKFYIPDLSSMEDIIPSEGGNYSINLLGVGSWNLYMLDEIIYSGHCTNFDYIDDILNNGIYLDDYMLFRVPSEDGRMQVLEYVDITLDQEGKIPLDQTKIDKFTNLSLYIQFKNYCELYVEEKDGKNTNISRYVVEKGTSYKDVINKLKEYSYSPNAEYTFNGEPINEDAVINDKRVTITKENINPVYVRVNVFYNNNFIYDMYCSKYDLSYGKCFQIELQGGATVFGVGYLDPEFKTELTKETFKEVNFDVYLKVDKEDLNKLTEYTIVLINKLDGITLPNKATGLRDEKTGVWALEKLVKDTLANLDIYNIKSLSFYEDEALQIPVDFEKNEGDGTSSYLTLTTYYCVVE